MTEDVVDLRLLAKLGQKANDEIRTLRKEVADIRTLSLQTYDCVKRLERRFSEMRDDLELTIKVEFGGGIAHLQTVLENTLARIEDKVGDLSERVGHIENNSPA